MTDCLSEWWEFAGGKDGRRPLVPARPVPPPSRFPAEIAWYGMARMPNATEVGSGSENERGRQTESKERDGTEGGARRGSQDDLGECVLAALARPPAGRRP